jgi:glycosyltransferase involved in cell wall biosynthesis
MSRRVVIITEIIAPYRIPVFNALARQDSIHLHVIFLSRTDASMRQWRVYEDEIKFSYEVLRSWRKRMGRYNLLLNHNVTTALRNAAPDVIVCGGYNYLASWQAMHWANRNRVQFLLWSESTARDHRGQRTLVESLKKMFFRQCDAFVVPGKSALDYLEQMGVPAKSIFIARNAVDISLFSEIGRKSRIEAARARNQMALPARYFLFVGRLVREKGVLDLLAAYRRLPANLREQIGLVFVGDGPLRAELEVLARDVYPGMIHFAGFVDRNDLAPYYGLAECLVLPTYTDTWGLVVNEAMACGLPVICTNVAGCAAELVQSNGRVVDPGNDSQLCHAMLEIACDPVLRDGMSAESETMILQYSPDAWASGMVRAAHAMECHD